MKKYKKILLIILAIIGSTIIAGSYYIHLQLNAIPFDITLPDGWNHTPEQGIDTQIGKFEGDNITLYYDYGFFASSGTLKADPSYIILKETINGNKAQIGIPNETGNGDVTIAFQGLRIYGKNLTAEQQQIVLTIFRSVDLD